MMQGIKDILDALKQLQSTIYLACDEKPADDISKIVRDAVTEITSLREQLEIAKKDGWISVKDRLPDDCDEYAVWMLDTITQQEYFTTSHLNPAKTGFYVDYIDDDTPREQVTHWQPLPEPPKE